MVIRLLFSMNKKYGQASFIDVSNPLKVLLYYKDFATVVYAGSFLNIRNTIDLRKQNILQVKAIGQSYDNKIWVYDELESKLKKLMRRENSYWKHLTSGCY